MKTVASILLVTVSLGLSEVSFGQLTINNTGYTPTTLVSNLLLPSGSSTSVSNVTFSGILNQSSRYQVGAFQTAATTLTGLGFSTGVVLTSGNTSEIPLTPGVDPKSTQQSRNYTSCTPGEVRKGGTCPVVLNDLTVLAGTYNYYNTAILEFDFVAAGSAVSFRYVFGSEEYEDNSGLINYQCSDYNDRFAFLLSGPGIAGGQGYTNNAKNIARLSNGSIVSINGVNNGVVGSSGGAPAASKCLTANPAWSNGSATAEYLGTIDGTNMNGNTRILTAFQSGLTPGATYHIKLIIMDVNDGAYDSVVYLEGGSFTSDASALPVELEDYTGFCTKESNVLQWTTASERNNDYFTLERYDATSGEFEWLAKIDAAGNATVSNNYRFEDPQTASGISIYRLSQTDLDGTRENLKTIAVQNNCSESQNYHVALAANELSIQYSGSTQQHALVEIVDINGKVIYHQSIVMVPDSALQKLTVPSLGSGIYLVKIQSETDFYLSRVLYGQ